MLICGDARTLPLADGSVQCVVTSPPYWGLRDYGLPPSVWDADEACAHVWGGIIARAHETRTNNGFNERWGNASGARHQEQGGRDGGTSGAFCSHCPAWRGVLGLEPTPELYVQHLVAIFREVRRVLRADGACWLNLGDSYAGGHGPSTTPGISKSAERNGHERTGSQRWADLKPKDLVGIPWRVAFALQADGWYLRADVIWAKPNPMPESVTDRPTKAHEYLFLLAKSERYYYDAEAVREPNQDTPINHRRIVHEGGIKFGLDRRGAVDDSPLTGPRFPERFVNPAGRNRRSVWTIATEPYPEAHFATFPEALVAPCVLAGTSERGACVACGGPTCACAAPTRPCVVLDPFAGSGTVGAVAERFGRQWIGVDLKPEYLAMARRRTAQRGFQFVEPRETEITEL